MPVRGRFAPSPSGRLHIGNMLSSLLAWLDVRSRGGEMLFRLEDLDPERSWEDCALMMADDLRWLGLDWDLGWPMDSGCRQGAAHGGIRVRLRASGRGGAALPLLVLARGAPGGLRPPSGGGKPRLLPLPLAAGGRDRRARAARPPRGV